MMEADTIALHLALIRHMRGMITAWERWVWSQRDKDKAPQRPHDEDEVSTTQ